MRSPLVTLLVGWVSGLSSSGCSRQEAPSVLISTLDTTRADRLGPYGHEEAGTPLYDALAEDGVVFERAYSTCPLTIPSHSTIFTGRTPPSHGVRDNGDYILGEEALTLAERLGEQGWSTAAFTAAFPTQARWGLSQGFQIYHDPLERLPTQLDWRDERRAEEVVDDALTTLAGVEGPVFSWVHLFDAHWPYDPPEPYATRFAGRPYDGEIAYASDQVGRLLEWWDVAHPRSIVVVTADHGEGMGDGGEMTHGFLLHDGTVRVPLIVRARGLDPEQMASLEPGSRVQDPVSHIDIAPTVLNLLGIEGDALLQGRDLRQGGSDLPYSEALTGQFSLGLAPLFAYVDEGGRYMEGSKGEWYPFVRYRILTGPDPLYDLNAEATRLAALRATLDEVIAPEAALDAEALEQLVALGYMGGDTTSEAGDIDPRDVIDIIPLTWRVRQALGSGHPAVADAMIERLEARMPGTYGVDLLRAQVLRAKGQQLEALSIYVDLFHRSPSSTVALQAASIHASLGEWASAEGWFEEALALQPASPEAMGGLVTAVLARGDEPLARELANRFLATYPDHAEIALVRAELLLEDGRLDDALEEASWALDRMPASQRAHSVAARILWEQGRADEAIDFMSEANRLDPYDLVLRLRLARALLEVGRNAEAVRTLRPAARLVPEDAEVLALSLAAEAALEAELGR